MAENKKSVLLYCDLIHTVEKMDNETAGLFFKHYLRYVNDLNPETDNIVVDISFESVKQNLKRDLKKWEQRAENSRKNGLKGGRPKTQITQQVICEPTKPVKDKVTVTVNVTDTVKDINNIKAFDFFWNLYDKKIGDKTKVFKKWLKLSDLEKESINTYIPKYKISQPEKKFRKNPETFLNNKSWNDEILENNSNGNAVVNPIITDKRLM